MKKLKEKLFCSVEVKVQRATKNACPLGKENDRGRSRHVRDILLFITRFGTI